VQYMWIALLAFWMYKSPNLHQVYNNIKDTTYASTITF